MRFIALRATGDPHAAEDIAQESIMRAMAAVRDPQRAPVRDLTGFLHGIARHLIADVLRERRRTASLAHPDALVAERPDVLRCLVADETLGRLRQLLRKMPRGDRVLLEMSFVYGRTSREIAGETGETAEAVRKRKSRLIERLRAALNG